jgi:hypothetical protein
MKYYHLLLLVPFFVACSSKNAALEHLENNAKKFKDISNTEYLLNDKEIAYFTLDKNRVTIQLINRDPFLDNKIKECTINNKKFAVTEDTQSKWDNNYIIELDKPLESAAIKCTLTDGSQIAKTIKTF